MSARELDPHQSPHARAARESLSRAPRCARGRDLDADGGTDVFAVHDGLPRGVPPADNEAGWRSSLAKLAALVESG